MCTYIRCSVVAPDFLAIPPNLVPVRFFASPNENLSKTKVGKMTSRRDFIDVGYITRRAPRGMTFNKWNSLVPLSFPWGEGVSRRKSLYQLLDLSGTTLAGRRVDTDKVTHMEITGQCKVDV